MNEEVEYKLWPRNTKYRVGSDGSIWTPCSICRKKDKNRRLILDGWRRILSSLNHLGYERLKLVNEFGISKEFRVHTVVLETFVSYRPDGMECRHLNDIKTDNRLCNLLWGTKRENHLDQGKNKGFINICGKNNPKAKMSLEDVELLKSNRVFSLQEKKDIAKRNNVTLQTIYRIIRGAYWNEKPYKYISINV